MGQSGSTDLGLGIYQLNAGQISSIQGVSFLLQQAVASEKVTGFVGNEAVAAFNAKLADGTIVRNGALPQGFVDVVGPVMDSLDGEAYATRRSALEKALGSNQVQQYSTILRKALRDEYAVWAARGGSISLAKESKPVAARALLAMMCVESPTQDSVSAVADFNNKLRQSLAKASPQALETRQRLVDTVIDPTISASRKRVADGHAKGCIMDVLVGQTALKDEEIRAEMLNILVSSLSTLEHVMVNSITAMNVNPSVKDKIYASRDAFAAKYTTVDDRWNNLNSTGYIHRYVKEVARLYGATPTLVTGRATKTTDFTTPKGPVTLKSGSLATAWVQCQQWPNTFDPDRFVNQEDATLFPQTIDEPFKMLLAEGAFASLLDFDWNMDANQDYTLDSTMVPVGQLMASGFRWRNDIEPKLFAPEGAREDWVKLKQVQAEFYKNESESVFEAIRDTRLDFWTHTMIKLIGDKQLTWTKPDAPTCLKTPADSHVLSKVQLPFVDMLVPSEDEDVANDPIFAKLLTTGLRDVTSFKDRFDADNWSPGEDREGYVMSKMGKMWPRTLVHWDDRYSDRALELLAFDGVAQHMLEKLPQAQDDGSYYGIFFNFMDALDVRPGFAKYGADAFFTKEGKVVKIIRQNKTIRPGDKDWEYAKLAFRGSLLVKVTAIDHLLTVHETVANYLTQSSREQLPPAHPLRRLIKPFTFRSNAINYASSYALNPEHAMLHRATSLSTKGLEQTFSNPWKFETFPDYMARHNVDTVTLPFYKDGMDYWTAVRGFVGDYVDLYYATDDTIASDKDVQNFYKFLSDKWKVSSRPLTKDNLKDVVAQAILMVTGMHNYVGTIAEYVVDPAFTPFSWVEGELAGRPGTTVRTGIIMAATGFPQPMLMEDFTHLMLDDKAKAICKKFQSIAAQLTNTIDGRNANRPQKFLSFSPSHMEISVGI